MTAPHKVGGVDGRGEETRTRVSLSKPVERRVQAGWLRGKLTLSLGIATESPGSVIGTVLVAPADGAKAN